MLYLAALRAGAVFLPLNSGYTPAEVESFLGDAEPRLLVCDPEAAPLLAPVAKRAGARLETLGVWRSPDCSAGTLADHGLAAAPHFATVPRQADDLAALLYTSGTTGRSKGAMLTHENLRSNAAALAALWRFTSADTLLHALPIFHTHGLFVATNVTLLSGGRLWFLPRFDAEEVIDALPQASVMMGVPTFYTPPARRAAPRRRADRPYAPLHFRLGTARRRGPRPMAGAHRPCHPRALWHDRDRHDHLQPLWRGKAAPAASALPLPGVSLRIADPPSGRPLPQGEVGVIEVKGPNVFKGYWRQPDKTAAEFRHDGFFITGDLGRVDAEGYLHIVGRSKDLIITGGLNVYPREIETAIEAIPGVAECAVIGLAHPDFGEGVTALVVAAAGADLDERTVLDALKDRLAKFKLPKRVLMVPALPRNAMGKIEKAALRTAHADLYAA